MKNLFLAVFLLGTGVLMGQEVDSVRVTREVDSLIEVSLSQIKLREFDKALTTNSIAKKYISEKLHKDPSICSNVLWIDGKICEGKREYTDAENYFVKAKECALSQDLKSDPYYVKINNSIAGLYMDLGKYSKAEECYKEGIDFIGKRKGKNQIEYAITLSGLAILYRKMGVYEKSEQLHEECKEIISQTIGKENSTYGGLLSNYSNLCSNMGKFEKAIELQTEAILILEKTVGKSHIAYATSIGNLGNCYSDIGDYNTAERCYTESKSLREKIVGKKHPLYCSALINLASFCNEVGDYNKAIEIYGEAIICIENTLGKKHPNYAGCLHNIALVSSELGDYEKAENLFIQAINFRRDELGEEHMDFLSSQSKLANLYFKMGRFDDALPLYNNSLKIRKEKLGENHPEYAKGLNDIAQFNMALKNYSIAETQFREAISIWTRVFGEENAYLLASLSGLSDLLWLVNENEVALLLNKISLIQKKLILKASQYMTDSEVSKYVNRLKETESKEFSFLFNIRVDSFRFAKNCFNSSLFYKSYYLRINDELRKTFHSDSISVESFNLLKSYHRRLATEYAKPIADRKNVPELEEKANTLEKELRRSLPAFDQALTQVTWQDVRSKLRPNHTAIEFVRFRYYNPDPTDSILYAALVLRPDDEAPHFVYLCTEAQLKTVLSRWNEKNLVESPSAVYWPRQGEASLYSLLWQPLEALLPKGGTIWYSPAGLLHRLNLDAIGKSKYESLADR